MVNESSSHSPRINGAGSEGLVYTHDKVCLKGNMKIRTGAFVLSCERGKCTGALSKKSEGRVRLWRGKQINIAKKIIFAIPTSNYE
ncbi:MAG: hypothetical protein HY578_07910 [Nitrospinae bacterium]|nr:hypothetical protein [Nitrospinota bacterium]